MNIFQEENIREMQQTDERLVLRGATTKREAIVTGMMKKPTGRPPQIGIVDSWHPHWDVVRKSVAAQSSSTRSLVQPDGWLPARENLLVAFVNDDVAGHVCFRVEPDFASEGGHCVRAEVDSFGVDPAYEGLGLRQVLQDAATARARELNCQQLRGFELAR